MDNKSVLQDNRLKVFFAIFCATGWSLAYPLIKLGYQEFQLDSSDIGSKILFAGVRFLIAGSAVCFAIHNALLSYHPISQIAIYNSLIPVLGVIFAALLLQEKLRLQYIIAVALVACGIRIVNS